jgi:hypothetical protein
VKRESLVGIRTLREVCSSLDQVRMSRRARTLSEVRRKFTLPVERPEKDPKLTVLLAKERKRVGAARALFEKRARKVTLTRQKLTATLERHRALMAARTVMWKEYWLDSSPALGED